MQQLKDEGNKEGKEAGNLLHTISSIHMFKIIPPPATDTPYVSPDAKNAENAGLSEQHNIDRDPSEKETTYICRECPFYGNNKRSAVVHVRRLHANVCLQCPGCPFRVWGTKAYLDHLKMCPAAALHFGDPGAVLTSAQAEEVIEGLAAGTHYEAVPLDKVVKTE